MSARTVAMKDDNIANSMYMCVITKILESFERLLLLAFPKIIHHLF
jgi:hypothetical protein